MTINEKNGIRYFTFESLERPGVVHAVFTRRGGVSPAPWDALNVGGTVGDDPERVVRNRRAAFHSLDRAPESIYDVWQVHGNAVVVADAPRPAGAPYLKADAILTDRPEVTLFMRFADCVPILLYDPKRAVVGIVHAGWEGTVLRAAAAAVETMQSRYEVRPADVFAGIGPSIAAHHYPVGPEVTERVKFAFGAEAGRLLAGANGASGEQEPDRMLFDLWEANRTILEQAGVQEIEIAGFCTACHTRDWYSHRGENGRTGRFGALIGLG